MAETKQPVEGQLLYAVPQAAAVLGMSESMVWFYIKTRELRTRRVGVRVLVPRAELVRFANKDHKGIERIERARS